jgi:hypothetical protein
VVLPSLVVSVYVLMLQEKKLRSSDYHWTGESARCAPLYLFYFKWLTNVINNAGYFGKKVSPLSLVDWAVIDEKGKASFIPNCHCYYYFTATTNKFLFSLRK